LGWEEHDESVMLKKKGDGHKRGFEKKLNISGVLGSKKRYYEKEKKE